MVYGWLKTGLDWLLPPACRLCGDDGQSGRELCPGCEHELPWNRNCCERCAEPLPAVQGRLLCGRCLRRPPAFDQALAPLRFEPPISQLVHAFKFRGDLAAGRLLADLLADAVAGNRPALLLPVPLHDRRLRRRGFNQALELARRLSYRLGIPVNPRILARCRDTPPQHEMPAQARRANVRGAFEALEELPAVHVALVDDVLTTGNTAAELARLLKRTGAARVEVWAVARA